MSRLDALRVLAGARAKTLLDDAKAASRAAARLAESIRLHKQACTEFEDEEQAQVERERTGSLGLRLIGGGRG